jgi:hypothetical protein
VTMALFRDRRYLRSKGREHHTQAASRHDHQGMSGALIAFPLLQTYRR